MDELRMIQGCKKGDAAAQRALFESYSRGMMAVCKRYIGDRQEAEEILLNGFFKFFDSIQKFRYTDGQSIGKWLKTIVLNECFMHLRRGWLPDFPVEHFSAEAQWDDGILSKLGVDDIMKMVNAMPEGYRVVFNLHVIDGYSHVEIAGLLQITEGASRSQLSRARVFLQKQVSKSFEYEPK